MFVSRAPASSTVSKPLILRLCPKTNKMPPQLMWKSSKCKLPVGLLQKLLPIRTLVTTSTSGATQKLIFVPTYLQIVWNWQIDYFLNCVVVCVFVCVCMTVLSWFVCLIPITKGTVLINSTVSAYLPFVHIARRYYWLNLGRFAPIHDSPGL